MNKVLRLKWRARMFISSVRQLSDGGSSARAIGGKSGDRLTFRLPIKGPGPSPELLKSLINYQLRHESIAQHLRMSARFPDRSRSKRSRSRSPHSDHTQNYTRRSDERDQRYDNSRYRDRDARLGQSQARGMKDQMRLNQLQEDERVREWVAQEDIFVLKQAKKKAEIRVKEGRAKPIDWLTVMLRVIDPTRNPLDDEITDSELDLIDPEGVFEGLSQTELGDLEKDIDTFLGLESNSQNRDYWRVNILVPSVHNMC